MLRSHPRVVISASAGGDDNPGNTMPKFRLCARHAKQNARRNHHLGEIK